jgi:hypothetical protein
MLEAVERDADSEDALISQDERQAVAELRDEDFSKAMADFVGRFVEEKHYIVRNLAALLVNSRDLSRTHKAKAVQCVLQSNQRLSHFIEKVAVSMKGEHIPQAMLEYLTLFWQFMMNDHMLGDNFLVEVYRDISRKVSGRDEKLAISDLLVACCDCDPHRYCACLGEKPRLWACPGLVDTPGMSAWVMFSSFRSQSPSGCDS